MAKQMTVSEILDRMYQQTDKLVSEVSANQGATCRVGCSHCCSLLAIITAADGVYLADELFKKPDWEDWAKRMAEASKPFMYEGITKENWFRKRISCVFLKDNLCSVYEKRPAACRFHVAVSPPENCSPSAVDAKTATLDLLELEEQTSWKVALKMNPIPWAAPIPMMVLHCMKLVAKMGHPEKLPALAEASKGIPDPVEWMQRYGEALFDDAKVQLEKMTSTGR